MTLGVDTINGTAADTTVIAHGNTLNFGDVLNGGLGTDVLKLFNGGYYQLDALFDSYSGSLKKLGLPTSRQEFVERYVEPHKGESGQRLQGFFASFLGVLGGAASQLFLMLFVPLIMLFILLDMEQFKRRWWNGFQDGWSRWTAVDA